MLGACGSFLFVFRKGMESESLSRYLTGSTETINAPKLGESFGAKASRRPFTDRGFAGEMATMRSGNNSPTRPLSGFPSHSRSGSPDQNFPPSPDENTTTRDKRPVTSDAKTARFDYLSIA